MSETRGLLAGAVRNPVFANLSMIGIIVAGVVLGARLPRETFPETALDHVRIETIYPGASPEDVEDGINIRIERAIEGIPGIWEIGSEARENVGVVVAAFDPRVSPTSEVLRQVKDRVDAVRDFPEDAESPIVEEAVIRNEAVSLAVHGDVTERTLKQLAREVRDELLALQKVSQISVSGLREDQISIEVTEESLQGYGISIKQVGDAVRSASLDLPAGTLRTTNEEISIRTMGRRRTAQDFEDIVVIARPDGTVIRLGQLAEVRHTFDERPIIGRFNGQPGAMVTVYKTRNEDLMEIAEIVRQYADQKRSTLPDGVELTVWADMSRDVNERLSMLLSNAAMGMVLVFLTLLLFIDLRTSMAVLIGIPVSFAGAIVIASITGNTLNMITLLGFIMAVGIIVDDAIVIAEHANSTRLGGVEPELATIRATRQMAMPVLGSSVTTIIGFLPLMFVDGVMGKLIYVLPVVVIAGIAASAFEAFFILPAHLVEFGRFGKRGDRPDERRFRTRVNDFLTRLIEGPYRRLLHGVLQRRWMVASACLAAVLLTAGLIASGRTPFVLMPPVDGNTLRARIRFPEGTPIDQAAAAVAKMEQAALGLNDDPELKPSGDGVLVQEVYSVVGEWAEFIVEQSSALGEVNLELMPAELRNIDSRIIMNKWREAIGHVPDAVYVTLTGQQLGPTDKPIEIRLLGQQLDDLRAAADDLEAQLASFTGVHDITDNLVPGKRELRVRMKPTATSLGLTTADLATQLREGLVGSEITTLHEPTGDISVQVRYADEERQSLSTIEQLRIRTPSGEAIPFPEVARAELGRGFMSIGRQDGRRRVRIQADVDERIANAEEIVQSLEAGVLEDLSHKYPGVSYLIDGQRKRINESVGSLTRGFLIALVAIFVLLASILRSYLQPMVIMAAIPLGFMGAVLGHAVLGYDLSLMSLFGMVALAGVVVNDTLVLTDRIRQTTDEGFPIVESVKDAGEARFRAVTLTSLTSIAGLFPLLLERSTQAQSLIPMAVSLAFGLLAATVLTLLVVPAFVLMVEDVRRAWRWTWTKPSGSTEPPSSATPYSHQS